MFSMSFSTVLCVKKGHYCNIIASMPLVRRVVPARISPYIIRFSRDGVYLFNFISNPVYIVLCVRSIQRELALLVSIYLIASLAVTLVSNKDCLCLHFN